jgi:hypothetical protein
LFILGGTQAHAFRWTESQGLQDLGTVGDNDSGAFLINKHGQIAGVKDAVPRFASEQEPMSPPRIMLPQANMRCRKRPCFLRVTGQQSEVGPELRGEENEF